MIQWSTARGPGSNSSPGTVIPLGCTVQPKLNIFKKNIKGEKEKINLCNFAENLYNNP